MGNLRNLNEVTNICHAAASNARSQHCARRRAGHFIDFIAMYSLTMLFSKSTLAFMLLGLMKTARACGGGESLSIAAGTVYTCCSTTANAVGYAYSVDGGTHDDNIKVRHLISF